MAKKKAVKKIYAYDVDGSVHFKAKKPKRGHITLSIEDHSALIEAVNLDPDKKLEIRGDQVLLVDAPIVVTWEDIRFKAGNILRRTDRIVSIPDYHIDGVLMTAEQRDDVLAYRATLWTLEADYETPEAVVWPDPPAGV